jgi:hypothetical protein
MGEFQFEWPVIVELVDFTVTADALMKINTGVLSTLFVNQTGKGTCILSGVQELELTKFDLELDALRILINDGLIANVSLPATPDVLNALIGGVINAQIAKLVYASPYLCKDEPVPTPPAPPTVRLLPDLFCHCYYCDRPYHNFVTLSNSHKIIIIIIITIITIMQLNMLNLLTQ